MAATDAARMQALRAYARDDPAGLRYEETDVPAPGIGDVLLRVAAASFTPTELGWPSTWVDRAGRDRTPSIPGHEVSGTVVALGAEAGVPTPLTARLVALIHEIERGARPQSLDALDALAATTAHTVTP